MLATNKRRSIPGLVPGGGLATCAVFLCSSHGLGCPVELQTNLREDEDYSKFYNHIQI